MGVPRGTRSLSGRPDAPAGADGPPQQGPPRTWQSVARSAATAHRRPGSSPRSGKARGKQRRERAAARARQAAAERRAALWHQRTSRTSNRPPWASATPVPRVLGPAASFPGYARWGRPARRPSRRILVALAGAAVAVAVAVTLVAVTDPIGADRTIVSGAARGAGTYVRSTLTRDGRLITVQRVVSPQPVSVLLFQIRSGSKFGGGTPILKQLRVFANGRPVFDSANSVYTAEAGSVVLGASTRTVRLRYVTRAAVLTAQPTTTGRALVLANPLDVQVDVPAATEGGVVRLAGSRVLNVACVSGDATPQPCGRPVSGGWRVDLGGSEPVGVFAQVDLPTA